MSTKWFGLEQIAFTNAQSKPETMIQFDSYETHNVNQVEKPNSQWLWSWISAQSVLVCFLMLVIALLPVLDMVRYMANQNMVAIKKWFFFGPQKSGFRPENPFFSVFCQRGVRNPWHWFCFETFGSIVRLFVSEFRPFSWGEPGRRAEKSSPTPLWGHRLPVTALALSARRPCGPRTGWIIIIIMINIIDIICICRPLRGCPDFGK